MGHERIHAFTSTTEHNFGGLTSGKPIYYDGSNLVSGDYDVLSVRSYVTSGDVGTIWTSPVQILSAPGDNKAYMIHDVYSKIHYIDNSYSDNGDPALIKIGSNSPLFSARVLTAATDNISRWERLYSGNQVSINTEVYLTADSDPDDGNSALDIYMTYSIVNATEG